MICSNCEVFNVWGNVEDVMEMGMGKGKGIYFPDNGFWVLS